MLTSGTVVQHMKVHARLYWNHAFSLQVTMSEVRDIFWLSDLCTQWLMTADVLECSLTLRTPQVMMVPVRNITLSHKLLRFLEMLCQVFLFHSISLGNWVPIFSQSNMWQVVLGYIVVRTRNTPRLLQLIWIQLLLSPKLVALPRIKSPV